MGVTIQTSWTAPVDCSITVTDAGGPVVVPFAIGQHFRSTQEVIDYLKAQIEATLGSTWTFTVIAKRLWTEMSAYPFDWDWSTATDLRDYLGHTVNVLAQGAPWGAPNLIEGWCEFALDAQEWLPVYSGSVATWTMQTVLADGKSEQASVGTGDHRQTKLTLDLDNTAGTFAEHAAWEAWLLLIDDGRQFTVWPEDALAHHFSGCIDPSQRTITIRQTYPRQITHWRTSLDMLIQEVLGE